ncbi:Transcription initiation factor IIA large subunit like [Actinidia chinensis var. chinensis]|uniref:Transcription initiation factor IIA large subunit like n=1 Tax=Actinidia chinensis var. chinensis TaxID=1590841 RepID=A0A2R6QT22_ACTCC|nr:Transcription initiation factor IIA large subunit like [Actinidia chinensis var. chinensis]
MASSTTSGVYVHVIEDVINKMREEFMNNGGPGESVLNELQGIWELKMMQAGAILGPIDRSSAQKPTPGGPITPVHDLNVPYEGTEEYETPTAEILFPPTPLQTPIQTPLPGTAQTPLPGTAQTPLPGTAQTPLPGTVDSSMYNIPTGGTPITPNDYPALYDSGGVNELKAGRPSPYMQPPSAWMNQRPPLSVDVNVAYEEGRDEVDRGTSHQPMTQDFFMVSAGKRKREDLPSQYRGRGYIPQRDGAGDAMSDDFQVIQGANTERDIVTAAKQEVFTQGERMSSRISQLDGPIPDPYDDVLSTPNIYNYQGVVNEDYNIVNTPAPIDQAATPAVVTQYDAGDDDDDEPLNENDDDDLDDVDQGEELNTQHLVLAQFDKVTRTKSKWKCTLKDGIMHINNKDILFNKASGEFDF